MTALKAWASQAGQIGNAAFPPISAVRRSCRGSSLAPLAADTRPECVSLETSLSSGRLHLLSLVRSTRALQDCSDRVLAEPDMAADQPVAQTSLCQLEDLLKGQARGGERLRDRADQELCVGCHLSAEGSRGT